MMQKTSEQKQRLFFGFSGSSSIYVLVILFVVCMISYLLVGGLFPRLNKKPLNPQSVQVADASISGKTNTLQLVNLQIASESSALSRDECLNKTGVLLLIDESSSMDQPSSAPKIDALRVAVKSFLNNNFSPNTLVGLYVFSSPDKYADPRELVPLGYYGENKSQIISQIDAIDPFGFTYMKDGFVLIKDSLQTAANQFLEYRFFVVFLSDGTPDPAEQNPETIAEEIKRPPYNATIFSIALDQEDNKVMRNVASEPKSTYFIQSPTAADLQATFQTIGQRICN